MREENPLMSTSVRTAVIPAAGLGTRFLPATKAMPKEMLTVVDRPSIQWVVEEAVAAGIDDIVIITSPHKKAVEDHFDRMAELEAALESKGKREMLGVVRHITDLATFHFTRQGAPLGLGHAVGTAARHVRDEPFAVLLPDELLPDGGQTLSRMIEVAEATGESVISLVPVEGPEISNYGCAGFSERQGDVITVDRLVEKPAFEDAPSNLRITGRYVLTPDIFENSSARRRGGWRDPADRRHGDADRRPWDARPGRRRRGFRRRAESRLAPGQC